jgi:hypothetical protein
MVQPTPSLLKNEGFLRQAGGETGRRPFEITQAGRAEPDADRTTVEALFARMEDAARRANPGRPRIARAMANPGMALKARVLRPVSPEELDRIVGMIDDTAAAMEES